MTYDFNSTLPEELLEPIIEHGLDILPELIQTLVDAAMQVERQQHLGAVPYERSSKRRGHANGYKSKTVATRLGKITFQVPQVREGDFYPSSLEKGIRSERALKLALAMLTNIKQRVEVDPRINHDRPPSRLPGTAPQLSSTWVRGSTGPDC